MKRIYLAMLTAVVGLALTGTNLLAGKKDGCESKPCMTCISVPKEKTTVVYRAIEEDYCLGQCRFSAMMKGKCDCEKGSCAKPRVRHLLVIKKVKCCDGHKHIPVVDDCCANPTFYTPGPTVITTPPTGGPETLTKPPMEVKPMKK